MRNIEINAWGTHDSCQIVLEIQVVKIIGYLLTKGPVGIFLGF